MNETNKYSDEHISAFIDGELDNDERAILLMDVQEDNFLAQRVNEARLLKEKVQLAYFDLSKKASTKKIFSCPALFSRTTSLVAGVMILLATALLLLSTMPGNDEILLAKQLIKHTDPIAPEAISATVGTSKQVVINISRYQSQDFDNTIEHIEALLQEHSDDELFSIEIVANKTGLKAFDSETSVHAERINQMTERFSNLRVVACAKSLAKLAEEGNPVLLMRSIMITSSAAEQVAKRTADGWLYLKL